MPESSDEKTKRKLATLMTSYRWLHQYTVFYEDAADCYKLLEDGNRLKKLLIKDHAHTPFLVCYRTIYKDWKGLQAYVTIFSTIKIEAFSQTIDKAFSAGTIERYRSVTPAKLEIAAAKIKKHKLHDLNLFFGKKTRRYSVLNRLALQYFKNTG